MVIVSSSHDSEEAEVFGSGGEEPVRDAHGTPLVVPKLCHQRLCQDVGSFEHTPYGGKGDDEYDPDDDDEDDDEEDEVDVFPDDPDADFDEEEEEDEEDEDEDENFDDDFEDMIRLSA